MKVHIFSIINKCSIKYTTKIACLKVCLNELLLNVKFTLKQKRKTYLLLVKQKTYMFAEKFNQVVKQFSLILNYE